MISLISSNLIKGFKMKLQKTLSYLINITLLFVIVSCSDNGSNRSASSNGISPGLTSQSGVHILSACSCKNGVLVDGTEGCNNAMCIGDSKTFANISVTIGKDIYNPIYKANGKTFSTLTPLKSVCGSIGYKCQIKIDETYIIKNGDTLEEKIETKKYSVLTTSSTTPIVSDAPDRSIIRLNDLLRKASNKITFEILFKDIDATEYEVVHQSIETPTMNTFKGDGFIDPALNKNLYGYNCAYVHVVANGTGGTYNRVTMETFNYQNSDMPQYIYKAGQSWPFLCHEHIPPVDSSGAPVIKWVGLTGTSAPVLNNTQYYETLNPPFFPRLNTINTGISFWGGTGIDSSDFSITFDALIHGINFDIERRIYSDFIKKENNGEWIEGPIFSQFKYLRVPDATPIIDPTGNKLMNIPLVNGGYFMEPQPESSSSGPRYTYKCPSKDALNASSEGRLASIKKVLSSPNQLLRYETKPFFAACAAGSKISSAELPTQYSPFRRVIYLSYDDILKILQTNNPNKSKEDIDELLFGEAIPSNLQFSLNDHFKLKRSMNLTTPNETDFINSTFRLVSPTVVNEDQMDCAPSSANSAESQSSGYVFGCYPIEIK